MFEDAVDSGDDEQRVKTRKTASGRVLIHSKEGTNFTSLKSTYAVLLGGEIVDGAMLLEFMMERVVPTLQAGNADAQLAANELLIDMYMWLPRLGTCRTLPEVWHSDTADGAPAERPPPGGPGPASTSDAPGGD